MAVLKHKRPVLFAWLWLVISVMALVSCTDHEPAMPPEAEAWIAEKTFSGDHRELESGDYGLVADSYLEEACERLAEHAWVELSEEDAERMLSKPIDMISDTRWYLVRAVTGFNGSGELVKVTIYDPPAIEVFGGVREENSWLDLRRSPVIVPMADEPHDVSVTYGVISSGR